MPPHAHRHRYPPFPLIEYWVPSVHVRVQSGDDILDQTTALHDPQPAGWPGCLTDCLDRMGRSLVGRVLLRHVALRLTIYYVPGRRACVVPGSFVPEEWDSSADRGYMRLRRGIPVIAAMEYNPLVPAHLNEHGLLKRPDVTLAHELAHAVGLTHGLWPKQLTPVDANRFQVPNMDEGDSLVIENMYRSEQGLPLRRSYLGNGPRRRGAPRSPPELAVDATAVSNSREYAPRFVAELEELDPERVPYNPFRSYAGRGVPPHLRIPGTYHRRP